VKKGLNAEFLGGVSDLEGSSVAGDYIKTRRCPSQHGDAEDPV